ncbi:AraC-type DNA-binding protein [Porphyromonadaceae bacterium KHP3R9]|jgi:AraC family transcriptional activator of pobA|nr:AraC-type DNA-binding protein [Porphyromonadaceae bacterium KHP3R9]
MMKDQYTLENRVVRRLLPDNGYLMLDSSTTDFHQLLKRTPFILDAGVVVFVCMEGEAVIVVDMKRIHIHRGSFVLLLPYSVIQLVEVSDELKITLIATGMGFLEKLAISHPVENYVEKIREMPCLQLNETQLESAKEIYRHVEKQYREASGPLSQEIRNTLMTYLSLEIVTLFAMNQPAGKPRISRQEQIFRNFTISLAKHVSEQRTVEFYANEACLTPKHFSMVIKKRSGKLPMEWITERTVALIKFLLTNTDQSIQEISNRLNFPNQSFFTRYFKRHTGLTPTAYRQKSIRSELPPLTPVR